MQHNREAGRFELESRSSLYADRKVGRWAAECRDVNSTRQTSVGMELEWNGMEWNVGIHWNEHWMNGMNCSSPGSFSVQSLFNQFIPSSTGSFHVPFQPTLIGTVEFHSIGMERNGMERYLELTSPAECAHSTYRAQRKLPRPMCKIPQCKHAPDAVQSSSALLLQSYHDRKKVWFYNTGQAIVVASNCIEKFDKILWLQLHLT